MNNLKVCFALGFFMLLSSGASQAVPIDIPVKTTTTSLQVLASVGPLEFLSGAKVTIRNAKGKVLGQRKTNIRGSAIFYLSESELSNLPFSAMTSGGKIIGQTGNQFKGPAFGGHLKGEISDVSLNKRSFIYLDLLSTTASVMQSGMNTYDHESVLLKEAFSIGKGFPIKAIRYKNNHVSWPLLLQKIQENHGYDKYVKRLASRIKRGNKITELTPSRYQSVARSKTSPRIAQATASSTSTSTSTFPQCNAVLGNGTDTTSSSSASTELIENFGVLSIDALLTFVGLPELVPSTDAAVGMLLAGGDPGSSGENATSTQLASVDTMLNCIYAQYHYLNEQINEIDLAIKIESAVNCAGPIQNDWTNYSGIVAAAQSTSEGGPAPVADQLNNSNGSLTQYVTPSNGDTWLDNQACIDTINDMLFGLGGANNGEGGGLSAWSQLNYNNQQQYAWYTQSQVQQLQTFLSYWGTLAYQEYVVNTEYLNWNAETTNLTSQAGNILGTTTCKSSTGNTMCNFMNNITNAYPGSLYSDEIGIWQSGMAVSAFPAGQAMNGLTQLTFNSEWALDQVNPECYSPRCSDPALNMGTLAVALSYSFFNAQVIDPCITNDSLTGLCVGLPSALEQFSYPQAFKTLQPTSTQIAALANLGPDGQTAQSFFFNAINYQLPPITTTPTIANQTCTIYGISFPCNQPTTTPTQGTYNVTWPIASQWAPANLTASAIGYAAFFTSDQLLYYTACTYTNQSLCASALNNVPTVATSTAYVFGLSTSPANALSYNQHAYTSSQSQQPPNGWTAENNEVFGVILGRTFWPNASCALTNPTTTCP